MKIAKEAVEHLNGSCESLYVNYSDYEENDEFLAYVDEHIFNCVCCGWWFPVSDLNHKDGEYVCEECV
jgi:hypothetical protein